MTQEQTQRIAYITHIHEAAAKSAQINEMLTLFYTKVCAVAKLNGIQLSTLQIPHTGESYTSSCTTAKHLPNNTFPNSTT